VVSHIDKAPKNVEVEIVKSRESLKLNMVISHSVAANGVKIIFNEHLAGPFDMKSDNTIPEDLLVVSPAVAEILKAKSGDVVDVKESTKNSLGTFKVRKALEHHSVIDSIEIPEKLYDSIIASEIVDNGVPNKLTTLSVKTNIGLHGSYVIKYNDNLGENEIGLQKMQMINLNLVEGDTISLEKTNLSGPSKIIIRPRRRFVDVANGNIYEMFDDAFQDYRTLTTGHTITLKLGDVTYKVDIMAILDSKGNEMHSAYMRFAFGERQTRVVLAILPALTPKDNALDVPSYDEDTYESSSEEDYIEDFQHKSRSPEKLPMTRHYEPTKKKAKSPSPIEEDEDELINSDYSEGENEEFVFAEDDENVGDYYNEFIDRDGAYLADGNDEFLYDD